MDTLGATIGSLFNVVRLFVLFDSARPSAKNPRGLRPLGFLALGLAEDVALGLLSENPSGLQSTPRGRLITLGTTLGHRFTWLPPRLFHRLSQS